LGGRRRTERRALVARRHRKEFTARTTPGRRHRSETRAGLPRTQPSGAAVVGATATRDTTAHRTASVARWQPTSSPAPPVPPRRLRKGRVPVLTLATPAEGRRGSEHRERPRVRVERALPPEDVGAVAQTLQKPVRPPVLQQPGNERALRHLVAAAVRSAARRGRAPPRTLRRRTLVRPCSTFRSHVTRVHECPGRPRPGLVFGRVHTWAAAGVRAREQPGRGRTLLAGRGGPGT
jgi:hypothetical protein